MIKVYLIIYVSVGKHLFEVTILIEVYTMFCSSIIKTMMEIGRGFGGKRELKQNMKVCCLSDKTELNKDVKRLLRLSPGDDNYVEDVWISLNLSCS